MSNSRVNSRNEISLIVVTLLVLAGLLAEYTEAVPSREILKSNRKVNSIQEKTTEEGKICKDQINSLINPIISLVSTLPTTIISIVGNLTSGATDGLGSLFMKPSGGGGGGLFNFNKNGTISGCNSIDPLLIANIPGIFIGVPLVILGVAILIAAIAAIVIAIGGFGGDVTKSAYEMKNSAGTGGYAPSVMPMYGTPVSTYGSSATVAGPSYSRLAENVDTATKNFNNAYDSYSGLLSQAQESEQQQQQSPQQSNYDMNSADASPNLYDGWNNHVVMKRMKQD